MARRKKKTKDEETTSAPEGDAKADEAKDTAADAAPADETPTNEPNPSNEEMAEAGLIPDQDTDEDLEPLPSIEDVIRAGHSLDEAQDILKKLKIERDGLRQHYKVKCAREQGFWRIGRHFGREETNVYLDDLTNRQIAEMEKTHSSHLNIERVGFEPATAEEIAELESAPSNSEV